MPRIPFSRISRFWGFKEKIRFERALNDRASVVSSGRFLYVLKRRAAGIPAESCLSELLANLVGIGVPVSAPVYARSGKSEVRIGKYIYSLFTYIEGEKADSNVSHATPEMAVELGVFTGRLHKALKEIDDDQVERTNLLKSLTAALRYFSTGEFEMEFESVEDFFTDFYKIYYRLPVQIIHGDYHPGNIIIHEGKVSGIVDFDCATREVKVLDLAYLVHSVFAEFLKMGSPSLFLYLLPYLLDGYSSQNSLSSSERESFVYLLSAISIIQIHYFAAKDLTEEARFAKNVFKWLYKNSNRIKEKSGLILVGSEKVI
ncbi:MULTISPECIES: phosphotransferase enzyme family protein [unclassified Mesotoga]|uniref:phosphotransferase enzyme family protein n=1 Tax=unclassified Mesotoga TaxID=1184398 RepID=UPI000EF18F3D|nr:MULTISPECIES: phosphotransferase [unclassified Mesotoga]MDI9367576.1 phosphotransferase [Thermotogota bacterium]NLT43976.1 phosphotransferase [Thermotogaceae bacterium]MDD3681530.1 phosphotransferase [Mesotoga sp.]MDD4208177.1 phosphotransferase [Mesotoga sp.]MDD4825245.1 phosphotransferase [Mesotoga sp.]